MTFKHCSVDIETYSDIDIKKAGLYKYARSPEFRVLLIAYAVDNGPVQIIDLTLDAGAEGAGTNTVHWQEFLARWHDPFTIMHSYNAAFEAAALNIFMGHQGIAPIPLSRWRCTMAHGLYCGYTAGLAATGEAMGLPQDKRKLGIGQALIRKFCIPQKGTKTRPGPFRVMPTDEPEKWELFKAYCKQDVETEREIERRLSRWPMPEREQKLWVLTTEANELGVGVDMDMVHGALDLADAEQRKLETEAREISGLQNPKSVQQLMKWLNEELNTDEENEVKDLRKATVSDLLAAGVDSDKATRMLELRQLMSKTSTKKYNAIEAAVCSDDRVRGMMFYYGANRTGRFSGRLVQLQNLVQNHLVNLDFARECVKKHDAEMIKVCWGAIPDVLSQLIRTAFVPSPGKIYAVADYSAIEARVVAWLAGEEAVLKAFREGKDIYCEMASQMFGVPVEKHGQNADLRQKGKVAILACIAEGQPVLTDRGLVPIEQVKITDRLWDGESWVRHNGVIYKGEREVITYEGLTATPDHLVWVEGQPEPVQFGVAAASGARLVRTGSKTEEITPGKRTARLYDIQDAGPHHRFTVSGHLVHNCGYGGGESALIAMGALKMGLTEDELPEIKQKWRQANPSICRLWNIVEAKAIATVETGRPQVLSLKQYDPERARQNENLMGADPGSYSNWFRTGVDLAVFRREVDQATGQDFLTIQLPTGRKLFYAHPHLSPAKNIPDKQSLHYYGTEQATKKWGTVDTWGGKLVENCVAWGTLVLTDRGLVPIELIAPWHRIWDGVEFVEHGGLIDKGRQNTIRVDGIELTPEHKILTTKGWVRSGESRGFDWQAVPLPYGIVPSPEQSPEESPVEMSVRVRSGSGSGCEGPETQRSPHHVLRMYEGEADRGTPADTRDVEASRLGSVALNETALPGSHAQGLSQLWRAWHHHLHGLAEQLRGVLEGHGALIPTGAGLGSDRQQQGVLPGKLPMDDSENKQPEPENQPGDRHPAGTDDGIRAERADRDRRDDAAVPTGPRLADRIIVHKTERKELVYDIRNCGPRHRFTVYDPTTQHYRIVSNCTQAIARDCLAETLIRLREIGLVAAFSVHDEAIVEVDREEQLQDILDIMAKPLDWAPGLPLKGAGFTCAYYQKD